MQRDLEFLYEIGALRLIPRQWERFHLKSVQNLTEHHFRVAWLALLISAREGKGNTEKIMKMAIVHDVSESRTGDVDYIARQYVERNEDKAIVDIFAKTSFGDEFVKLWREYEQRKTIEAKIVKDADYLDIDLDLREQATRGNLLEKEWQSQRKVVRSKLQTRSAKQLFDAIKKSNPHDWHIKSPNNRLNGGDWKKS